MRLSIAVLVVLASVIAGAWFFVLSDGEDKELASYYMEARREVGEEETSIAEELPWLMYGGTPDRLWAWNSGGRTLWRIGFSDGELAGLADIVVEDGRSRSSYHWVSNTFILDEQDPFLPFGYPTVLGPLDKATVEEFLRGSEERVVLREEEMLGRRVLVLATEPLQALTDRYPSEKVRIWLDPEYMFVLRYEFYEEVGGGERLYYHDEATGSHTTRMSNRRKSRQASLRRRVPKLMLQNTFLTRRCTE